MGDTRLNVGIHIGCHVQCAGSPYPGIPYEVDKCIGNECIKSVPWESSYLNDHNQTSTLPYPNPAIVALCLPYIEPYFNGFNSTAVEMDVIEVNQKDFEACTHPIDAPTVPHLVHSSPSPYQVEGFVIRPRNNNDIRWLISKNKEKCLGGYRVKLEWTD